MVATTCFGSTLPSSGSVPSAFWVMLNWGAVNRILWMGVLCLVTWCVAICLFKGWGRKEVTQINNFNLFLGLATCHKVHPTRSFKKELHALLTFWHAYRCIAIASFFSFGLIKSEFWSLAYPGIFFRGGRGVNTFNWGQRADRTGSGGGSPPVRGSALVANEWTPYSY
jgi:hypothetical protein